MSTERRCVPERHGGIALLVVSRAQSYLGVYISTTLVIFTISMHKALSYAASQYILWPLQLFA